MSYIYYLGFFNAFCFLFYGASCLFSKKMKLEFNRFQLNDLHRQLTGALQLLGAIGLIIGLLSTGILAMLASAGLSLLMFLGVGVRMRIKDSIVDTLPATFFALLNFFITYQLALIYFAEG
ncbi:MAG: DoxX family protein [Psychroflexus sp.]|jgi:hypothetical protein|nr:DoxX family protein [Psychroflexus sp.]MDR9448379.1 DoxX family protein [Psychroflexus sp.]